MLGCCKRAMASASVRKRASSAAPAWPPDRIIFRATTRFELELPGLVDDAHAALAQLAQDLVAGHLASRATAARDAGRRQGDSEIHGRGGRQRYRFPVRAGAAGGRAASGPGVRNGSSAFGAGIDHRPLGSCGSRAAFGRRATSPVVQRFRPRRAERRKPPGKRHARWRFTRRLTPLGSPGRLLSWLLT